MNSVFYYVLTESDTSLAVGRPVYFNASGQLKYCTSTDTPAVGIVIDVTDNNGSAVACVGILRQVLKCRAKDAFSPTPGAQVLLSNLYNVTTGTELGMLGWALSNKDADGLVQVITNY